MNLKEIQEKLNAPKNLRNKFGNYNYRNCEGILEAVKPMLGDSILTLSDEMVYIGTRHYCKATAKFKEYDGTDPTTDKNEYKNTVITAYAREAESQKGMGEAQITGSASSYARKYALNGLFLIDDSKDDDSRNDGSDDYETKKDTATDAYKKALIESIKKETRVDKLNGIETQAFAQFDFSPDSTKKLKEIFEKRRKEITG